MQSLNPTSGVTNVPCYQQIKNIFMNCFGNPFVTCFKAEILSLSLSSSFSTAFKTSRSSSRSTPCIYKTRRMYKGAINHHVAPCQQLQNYLVQSEETDVYLSLNCFLVIFVTFLYLIFTFYVFICLCFYCLV